MHHRCNACGTTEQHSELLEIHVKLEHLDNWRPYHCKYCKETRATMQQMVNHLRSRHMEVKEQNGLKYFIDHDENLMRQLKAHMDQECVPNQAATNLISQELRQQCQQSSDTIEVITIEDNDDDDPAAQDERDASSVVSTSTSLHSTSLSLPVSDCSSISDSPTAYNQLQLEQQLGRQVQQQHQQGQLFAQYLHEHEQFNFPNAAQNQPVQSHAPQLQNHPRQPYQHQLNQQLQHQQHMPRPHEYLQLQLTPYCKICCITLPTCDVRSMYTHATQHLMKNGVFPFRCKYCPYGGPTFSLMQSHFEVRHPHVIQPPGVLHYFNNLKVREQSVEMLQRCFAEDQCVLPRDGVFNLETEEAQLLQHQQHKLQNQLDQHQQQELQLRQQQMEMQQLYHYSSQNQHTRKSPHDRQQRQRKQRHCEQPYARQQHQLQPCLKTQQDNYENKRVQLQKRHEQSEVNAAPSAEQCRNENISIQNGLNQFEIQEHGETSIVSEEVIDQNEQLKANERSLDTHPKAEQQSPGSYTHTTPLVIDESNEA